MKAVLSYLIVLISAVTYMILFDRDAGGIMTVFLIVVPVISIAFTLAARKKIEFGLKINDEIIKKNCTENIIVTAHKKTMLPVPIISFEVSVTERLSPLKHDTYRFSMSENKDISIDIEIFPEICGQADISISKMYITDYLGVFRFKISNDEIKEKIFILPEIYDIEEEGDILRSIYSTLPDNDDDDDAQPVSGRTAFPGYEYRSYVPGDSMKKINWKLSSKRNELFVRMDETSGMTLPDIVLDTSYVLQNPANSKRSMLLAEKITEGALAMLNLCVKNGIECTFSYISDGVPVKCNVLTQEDIERIATDISKVSFSEPEFVSETKEFSKSSEVSIVYTTSLSQNIITAAENASVSGNSMKMIIPEELISDINTGLTDIWSLCDDHTIKRIS